MQILIELNMGVLLGLALSVPFGPAAAHCIGVTLDRGRSEGLRAAFGATLGDVMLGAFGLAALSWNLRVGAVAQVAPFLLVAAAGMLVMRIRARKREASRLLHGRGDGNPARAGGARAPSTVPLGHGEWLATLLLTLGNPVIPLALVALLPDWIPPQTRGFALVVVLMGAALASGLWWTLLVLGTNRLRNRFRPRFVLALQRGSNVIVFGLVTLMLARTLLTSIS